MPYIPQKARDSFDPLLEAIWAKNPLEGELNYIITRILLNSLRGTPMSYSAGNRLIGIVECVKLELYRRLMAPYETEKIAENGDVYL